MRGKHLLLLVTSLALLGGALASGADPSPVSETQKIEALIAQLGSASFMEREAATRALEAIGGPALEGLRKAARGTEPEARRRAEQLIARIDRRLQTEQLLKPTLVHLVCQDAPVKEAVAQLAKKSGYKIALSGDAARYRDRRVTLDTGETTFWRALDRLCESANLYEADRIEIRGRRLVDAVADVELTDGAWRDSPVHYDGAARVRALNPLRGVGELILSLGVTLEPRVTLESLGNVHIEKAVDDRGQELRQNLRAEPAQPVAQPVWLVNGVGMPRAQLGSRQQQLGVQLQAGAVPSKSLKELTGCIMAQVRTPPEPVMTMDSILDAAGKTTTARDGGSLSVHEVTKLDNRQLRLRVGLQLPPNNGNNNAGVPVAGGQQIQIQVLGGIGSAGRFTPDPMGLSLEDDKGKRFVLADVHRSVKIANNVVTHELTLLFKPGENQGQPARLHHSASRVVHIELPFTIRNIPLP